MLYSIGFVMAVIWEVITNQETLLLQLWNSSFFLWYWRKGWKVCELTTLVICILGWEFEGHRGSRIKTHFAASRPVHSLLNNVIWMEKQVTNPVFLKYTSPLQWWAYEIVWRNFIWLFFSWSPFFLQRFLMGSLQEVGIQVKIHPQRASFTSFLCY